jgi:thiamine kinase-like enzyme
MTNAATGGPNTAMNHIWEHIEMYLKNMPPKVLGITNIRSLKCIKMTPGAYNLNFHISIDEKEFIFRVNIEQQSGLNKQAKYEYNILKFLQGHAIAPDVYYLDDTRAHFEFDILIEQYLAGPHLSFEKYQLLEVAKLLTRLHSLTPDGMKFITWQAPLRDTYKLVENDLANYKTAGTAEREITSLSDSILEKFRSQISKSNLPFQADSLNHTDVVCDNFIKISEGLRMIDWEKPRVDDVTYDLSCFLSEPAQLWCSDRVLNEQEREDFIRQYARLSGKDVELLKKKIHIREPMVSMHWVLWGATKLCDLRENRTKPELFAAHEEKIPRYEKIARVENLEKILSAL